MNIMTQRAMLTKRVNEILDNHISSMEHGSPDSPNLLLGGMLHQQGAGAIQDFLTALAKGVPLPILLAKLRFKGKGGGLKHFLKAIWGKGGCQDCETGMGATGGVITEKTLAGLQAYNEFMKEKKANGATHQEALAMWKAHKKPASRDEVEYCKMVLEGPKKIQAKVKKPKVKAKARPQVVAEDEEIVEVKPKKIRAKVRKLLEEPLEKMVNDSDRFEECMKLLGLPTVQNKAEEREQEEMAEDIEERMLEGLINRPKTPPLSTLDREGLEATNLKMDLDKELDSDVDYYNRYYEEMSDAQTSMGEGRGKKRKARGPLSAEHREKLMTGQAQFQEFMRIVKARGLTHKEALALHRKLKAEHGGNWWKDFKRGFMIPINAAMKIVPAVLPFL